MFGYFVGTVFIIIGLLFIFLKNRKNTRKVKAKYVGQKEKRKKNGDIEYLPQYEYIFNGKKRKFSSRDMEYDARNMKKEMSITINIETGKVLSQEDNSAKLILGIIFICIGIICFVGIVTGIMG